MKKYRHYEIGFTNGVDWKQTLEQCGENGWRCVQLFMIPLQNPTGGVTFNVLGAYLEQEYEDNTQVPEVFVRPNVFATGFDVPRFDTSIPPPPDGS